MTDFAFETITAAQALAFTDADRLSVSSGTASQTTVLFVADGTLSLSVGARTLVFGAPLAAVSRAGGLTYADRSELYIGSPGADGFNVSGGLVRFGAIYGGDGIDTLVTNERNWLVQGNQGNDRILVNSGAANTVYGGQGDDVVTVSSAFTPLGQFIQGNRGDDGVIGGNGADTILGGQGNDSLSGAGGPDFLNGNLGDDRITGVGQIFGEDGRDTLTADSTKSSTVRGGDGDDNILGTYAASDRGSPNVLMGEAGDDTVMASNVGHDDLFGGDGNDLLSTGGPGTPLAGDFLDGGAGADTLSGGSGADTLSGGDGADVIGGRGGAWLLGGGGGDRFILDTSGEGTPTLSRVIQARDWSNEDQLHSARAPANATTLFYTEHTAQDYGAAVAYAEGVFRASDDAVAVVQVGADVFVFSGRATGFGIDGAIVLIGRTLDDISAVNIV